MKNELIIKRTDTSNPDFTYLVSSLDNELWNELKEDKTTYDQYNKVDHIKTAIIIYDNEKPVAIGCYKKYNDNTIEIKRMYVDKASRGKGLSKMVLNELEKWAIENDYEYAILETSIRFIAAQSLYKQFSYVVIPNYDQYKDLEESICMKKRLKE